MGEYKMSNLGDIRKRKEKSGDSLLKQIIEHRWCYLFILPMAIMFTGFVIWPIIASGYFSLFDWNGIGWPTQFIGLSNFKELIKDHYFWNAFNNTYIYAIFQTVVKLPVALILAVILNNASLKGTTFYRTLYFLPVVTTTAIIGIIFTFILNPYSGALNNILLGLRVIGRPVDWLGVNSTAFVVLILIGAWQKLGQYMIYWLAGLQSIPEELYEAAKIDGASSSKTFLHITLPLLKPVGAIILLLGFVNSLRVFDLVLTLTGGGPNFATEMMGVFVYRNAFSAESNVPRMSYACAAGLLFGISLIIVAVLQSGITKKIREYRRERSF